MNLPISFHSWLSNILFSAFKLEHTSSTDIMLVLSEIGNLKCQDLSMLCSFWSMNKVKQDVVNGSSQLVESWVTVKVH